jgi:hypothetical protein
MRLKSAVLGLLIAAGAFSGAAYAAQPPCAINDADRQALLHPSEGSPHTDPSYLTADQGQSFCLSRKIMADLKSMPRDQFDKTHALLSVPEDIYLWITEDEHQTLKAWFADALAAEWAKAQKEQKKSL